jgi:hypothetical protein
MANDRNLAPAQVLTAHEGQPRIEKRFEQSKTVHEIAPVFLKNEARFEALFTLHFLPLLVQAFIVRELRQAMQAANIEQLPLHLRPAPVDGPPPSTSCACSASPSVSPCSTAPRTSASSRPSSPSCSAKSWACWECPLCQPRQDLTPPSAMRRNFGSIDEFDVRNARFDAGNDASVAFRWTAHVAETKSKSDATAFRAQEASTAVAFAATVSAPSIKGDPMNAFNVVRFRVKPGRDAAFLEAHRRAGAAFKGFVRGELVKTGERTYCMLGEWDSMASMVAARPQMIAILDTFRAELEDLGNGLGVTDPVSGEAVMEIKP